jgi:hypothetical protein
MERTCSKIMVVPFHVQVVNNVQAIAQYGNSELQISMDQLVEVASLDG